MATQQDAFISNLGRIYTVYVGGFWNDTANGTDVLVYSEDTIAGSFVRPDNQTSYWNIRPVCTDWGELMPVTWYPMKRLTGWSKRNWKKTSTITGIFLTAFPERCPRPKRLTGI